MRTLTTFLLSTALLAQAPSAGQPPAASGSPGSDAQNSSDVPGLKSTVSMSELMLEMVFPTSNDLFYVGRNENRTDKEWLDFRREMLTLAESANLMMAPNRARDKDRWMRDAKLLRDVGEKAYKLAKARDVAGLKGLNDELYESCQSCHEHYRPGYTRR
ncbi:MAG: hypothetical protein ABL967_15055 [Bryobacteraceae bacterium]